MIAFHNNIFFQKKGLFLQIKTRQTEKNDAIKIYNIVKRSGILDVNSIYAYLLVCTHFKNTSVVSTHNDNVIGFVSAYVLPEDATTLFIWQVGVDAAYRGNGIALCMFENLLTRKNTQDIQTIQTTISPSNTSSKRLFRKLADSYKAELLSKTCFDGKDFGTLKHEEEILYEIQLNRSINHESI